MDKWDSDQNPYSFTGTELLWVWQGPNDQIGVGMAQVGLEWPKWGQNGPSALDAYSMYLFEAQAVRNGYGTL